MPKVIWDRLQCTGDTHIVRTGGRELFFRFIWSTSLMLLRSFCLIYLHSSRIVLWLPVHDIREMLLLLCCLHSVTGVCYFCDLFFQIWKWNWKKIYICVIFDIILFHFKHLVQYQSSSRIIICSFQTSFSTFNRWYHIYLTSQYWHYFCCRHHWESHWVNAMGLTWLNVQHLKWIQKQRTKYRNDKNY